MIGSNTSAQHPLAYARITAAKKRGAKLITVDPRRTPVATLSDIHLAIRPGNNLALVKVYGACFKYLVCFVPFTV